MTERTTEPTTAELEQWSVEADHQGYHPNISRETWAWRYRRLWAKNRALTEALALARGKLCRYCADERYEDRGPDAVGEGPNYWHWGVGIGDKPLCAAADIRRAALLSGQPVQARDAELERLRTELRSRSYDYHRSRHDVGAWEDCWMQPCARDRALLPEARDA